MKFKQSRYIWLIYLFAISMLVMIAVVHLLFPVTIASLTRDVAAIARIHPFSGFLSNLGIYLWCVSAAVSLFSAMVLWRVGAKNRVAFLVSSGLLSAYLAFDDAFMFHEELGPDLLGIDEDVVFVMLGVVVFAYVLVFKQVIL